MADCIYVLYDRIFNSELELDNFILNNKAFIGNLDISDIVFSRNTGGLNNPENVKAFLLNKKNEAEGAGRISEIKKIKANKGFITFEEEELIKPYIGVNKALSTKFRDPLGRKFVKNFVEDNLKARLFGLWERDGLTEAYAELIGDPPGTKYTTDTEKLHAWNKLNDAWKKLGKTGTAVHKALELFWLNEMSINEIALEVQNETGVILTNEMLGKIQAVKLHIENYIRTLPGGNFSNALFIPEYPIIADTTWPQDENDLTLPPLKLLGVIDLLVVDNNGKVHVFDYKCSNKEIADWNNEKKNAFLYLLGTYNLALNGYGFDTFGNISGIIPIILDDFDNGNFSNPRVALTNIFEDYAPLLSPTSPIMTNLNTVLVREEHPIVASQDFAANMDRDMHTCFPSYRFQRELDEAIEKDLMRDLKYNESTGKYELINKKAYGENEFDSVLHYHQYLKSRNKDSFSYYNSLLKRAIESGDASILSQEESRSYLQGVSREWFLNQFAQFCTGNGEWEMIEVPEFEALGIVMLHNKVGLYYKIYVIDNENPRVKVPFKKGTSILGSFMDDITPELEGVVPLVGDIGNINNIKVMLALNNFPEIIKPGESIEGIYPICPRAQLGHHANSKQLLDNFRILALRAGIKNNFDNGTISFLPAYQAAYLLIREYGSRLQMSGNLNKVYSMYDTGALQLEDSLKALLLVKEALEDEFPDLTNWKDNKSKINFDSPQSRAYAKVMLAIAELQNGYYTLEVRDTTKMKLAHYIDNPEIQDLNLRNIYKITTNFHETYARRMNKLAAEYREVQERFWKKKGYSLARRNSLNDERVLYQNMFEPVENKSGIYKFKNPWDNNNDLLPEEREFLKWILDNFVKLKNPGITEGEIILKRSDPEYLDVPLLRQKGSKNPFTANGRKGLVSWFKRSVDYFRNFKGNVQKGVTEALTDKDSDLFERDAELFKAFDVFETSDNEVRRELLLKETDLDVFSDNIGHIFYMYAGAKIRKLVLDEYTPLLQALLVLNMMEAALNNINVDGNIDYILKYAKAKIFDTSIVPKQYRPIAKALEKIRVITTYATLGFSPRSGLFLMMEGVWKNASRAGIKPLGENQFGIKELKLAVNWIIGDTKDHFHIVSLGELINEQYRINDMDISSFAQHLYEGLFPLEFSSKAMWLTAAPDYFNRMSIFIAQMIKNGSFKAHKKDGMRLIYDWKLDDRFSAFANNDRRDMTKYNKQKALYHTMMAQFIKEGYQIEDENGNLRNLQVDMTSDVPLDPIPLAFTNLEARNIKSFADQLYGYYNHEDLFLFKSMLLGAQYSLFRTYWSSLKNRYFLKGGIYSNGEWVHATNKDGKPMYKKFNLDENGNLINVELVTNDTGEPFMIWKGSYLEGIKQTLLECVKALFNPDSDLPLKERAINILHGKTGNENDDVIRVRATNLKLFAHDMLVWAIIGLLFGTLLTKYLKEQEKADKNRKLGFGDMTLRAAESILVSSMVASTQDLGAFKDLASPLTDWTPPSFRVLSNMWDDGLAFISGDKSFTKAVVENVSVLRQTKNYWYLAEKMLDE